MMKKQAEAMETLNKYSIHFTTFNNGIHFVVTGRNDLIDFWPTTGKWKTRKSNITSNGITRLVNFLRPGTIKK